MVPPRLPLTGTGSERPGNLAGNQESGLSRSSRKPAGMTLVLPQQYQNRFEFVFYVEQCLDGQTVVCRAEIFEHSVLKAVLQVVDTKRTRPEVVDLVLARCIRWADLRIHGAARS